MCILSGLFLQISGRFCQRRQNGGQERAQDQSRRQQEQQRERKIRQQQDIEVDHSLDGRHLLSGRDQCSRRWGRKRAKERLCFCIKPLSRGLCRDSSPSRGALGIPSRFRGLALRSCLPCWRKVFRLRQMMILEPKANQSKNESPAKASPTRGGGIER